LIEFSLEKKLTPELSSKQTLIACFRLQQKSHEAADGNDDADQPPESGAADESTADPSAAKPADPAPAVATPKLLECPHCDELAGNDDAPNLRLHIFHHYKDHWTERVTSVMLNLDQGPML
jgi:hypothetical protein